VIYFVGDSEKRESIPLASIEDALKYFEDKEFVEVDTETEGFDPWTKNLLCWQIGDGNTQFVISEKDYPIADYKEFFEQSDKTYLFQNAKFDLRFLFMNNIVCTKVYDTYLVERMLNLGKPRFLRMSLDALVKRYCNVELSKEVRGQIHYRGLDDTVITYAGRDVKYLNQIRTEQMKKVKRLGLERAIRLQNSYCPVLAYCEFCGFKLDKEKWLSLYKRNIEKLEKVEKELDDYIIRDFPKYQEKQLDMFLPVGSAINWNSSHQVIPFFEDLGLDLIVEKDGKKSKSIEAPVIRPQKDKHPILPVYLRYKGLQKQVSTYGTNVTDQINPASGRLHTQFTQIMDTMRLSSGGKDSSTGVQTLNFQNIPAAEEVRSCFVAEEGNTLVVADYSGQEQIVLANQSMDEGLLHFYAQNLGDMHSFVASKIFPELKGLSLKEIKANYPELRQIAKAAGFAINYGGNGWTISNNLSIPIEQGEAVYKAYFDAFPGLNDYFKKKKDELWKKGYILFNEVDQSKLFFDKQWFDTEQEKLTPEFWDEYRYHKEKDDEYFHRELRPVVSTFYRQKAAIERKALNYPIQGTSASITKVAGILFLNKLIEQNLLFTVKICNFIHDEIVVECPEEIAEHVSNLLKVCMENAGNYYCKVVPLQAEPQITSYWKH